MFKIGQQVMQIDNAGPGEIGDIFTISDKEWDREGEFLKFECGFPGYYSASKFEPISDFYPTGFVDYLKDVAKEKREDAGHSGSFTDHGAQALLDQTAIFLSGWNHQIPKEWEKYQEQFNRETDPDYKTYIELRKRFEGK